MNPHVTGEFGYEEKGLRRAGLVMVVACLLILTWSSWAAAQQKASSTDWKTVEDAMGRPGQMQPEDVIKFGMPRKDLHVMVGNVAVKPGLALGS